MRAAVELTIWLVNEAMARPRAVSPSSRQRLLRAAAAEFAARGFDGAKVDRIAARAGVNKAMLYYHFGSKGDLYRAILRDLFAAVAVAVAAVREAGGDPPGQVRRFVQAVAREAAARPHFPPIWLREIAEGGRHLDRAIAGDMGRVVGALAAMLADGRRTGVFRETHPFVAQVAIVAPLLFFAASAPVREKFAGLLPWPAGGLTADAMVAYVQEGTLAALARSPREGDAAGAPGAAAPSPRPQARAGRSGR
jgi:AcrR family transcriptional regulator